MEGGRDGKEGGREERGGWREDGERMEGGWREDGGRMEVVRIKGGRKKGGGREGVYLQKRRIGRRGRKEHEGRYT